MGRFFKVLSLIIALSLLLCCFAGCGDNASSNIDTDNKEAGSDSPDAQESDDVNNEAADDTDQNGTQDGYSKAVTYRFLSSGKSYSADEYGSLETWRVCKFGADDYLIEIDYWFLFAGEDDAKTFAEYHQAISDAVVEGQVVGFLNQQYASDLKNTYEITVLQYGETTDTQVRYDEVKTPLDFSIDELMSAHQDS